MEASTKSYNGIDVIPEDIATVQGKNWLNSTPILVIIQMEIDHKKYEDQRGISLIDPLITSLIAHSDDYEEAASIIDSISQLRLSENLILMPINNQHSASSSGDHWSLCIMQTSRVWHLCSMNRDMPKSAKQALKYLGQFANKKESDMDTLVKQTNLTYGQKNSHDCGLFVIELARNIIRSYCEKNAQNIDIDTLIHTVAQNTRFNSAELRTEIMNKLNKLPTK